MLNHTMMYDIHVENNAKNNNETKENECICGYVLEEQGTYVNSQNQLTHIMFCESCGHIEHWVDSKKVLLEANEV